MSASAAPTGTSTSASHLDDWVSGTPRSPSGAYYAWIDADGRTPSFEYPEITGYALTHLAGADVSTDAQLQAGTAAVSWLTQHLAEPGAGAHTGYDSGAVYTFDLSMIATGLMAFGTLKNVPKAVERGRALAAGIRDEVNSTGRLGSIAPSSPSRTSRSAWSTEGVAHLVKVAQCLLWADAAGESGCRDAARAVVAQGAKAQQPDGRFVTHPSDRETMLHPHLYAVEGMYCLGRALDDEESLQRARRGAEWCWQEMLPSGGFPRYVSSGTNDPAPEQLDLTAQALRAALFTDMDVEVAPTVARLQALAVPDADGRALPYQPSAATVHLNTWVTLFAAQALRMVETGADLDWRLLV